MDDKDIVEVKLGPLDAELDFKGGKLVATVTLSLKQVLDGLAAKIGGPIPVEVAKFLEQALGLQ